MRWVIRIVLGVIALLALAEVGLQAWMFLSPAEQATFEKPPPPNWSSLTIKDPILVVKPNPDFPEHDSRGWRNMIETKQADIVAIGDSQTYGLGVGPYEPWPQQLEAMTGQAVYNISWGAYSPIQAAILVHQAFELKPKEIVVPIYFGNDFYDCYTYVHERGLYTEWFADTSDPFADLVEDGTLLPREERIQQLYTAYHKSRRTKPLRERVLAASKALSESPEDLSVEPPASVDVKASAVAPVDVPSDSQTGRDDPVSITADSNHAAYRFDFRLPRLPIYFKNRKANRMQADRDVYRKQLAKMIRKHTPAELIGQGAPDFNYRKLFSPKSRTWQVWFQDARVSEGFQLCFQAMQAIQALCQEQGVGFRVMFIPTKELVFHLTLRERKIPLSPEYISLVKNEWFLRARMARLLDEKGIAVVDTLPALRESLNNGNMPYRIDRDGHPVGAGYRAIAKAVQQSLNGTPPEILGSEALAASKAAVPLSSPSPKAPAVSEPCTLKLTLVEASGIPDPKQILPYQHAYAAHHYRVDAVLAGSCSQKEIHVARWAIRNGVKVETGVPKELEVDLLPYKTHGDRDGTQMMMTTDAFDLDIFVIK